MNDLFDQGAIQSLALEGADVSIRHNYLAPHFDTELLFQSLLNDVDWQQKDIQVWGKMHLQPRLVAWFSDAGRSYTYSGQTMHPAVVIRPITHIRDAITAELGFEFDSVLANLYRNENDSMGLHSDDEPELGPNPIIASYSLGEKRTFYFKHKHDKQQRRVNIELPADSLLVMKGETQKNWQHGIRKESNKCGPRVNLTFRNILDVPHISAQ